MKLGSVFIDDTPGFREFLMTDKLMMEVAFDYIKKIRGNRYHNNPLLF